MDIIDRTFRLIKKCFRRDPTDQIMERTKLTEVPQFAQWAEINQTDKFTCIEPLSGFRRIMREDEGYRIYLEPGASERAIGEALLEVLKRSRVVSPIDEGEFFEADRIMRNYRAWHEDFMKRYRYKTKREAYKNMRFCRAERSEGKISIKPHKRDFKPGLWWDLSPEKPSSFRRRTILELSARLRRWH